MREKTGKPYAFWMSFVEIEALQKIADEKDISRNEAARRAIRLYSGLPETRD